MNLKRFTIITLATAVFIFLVGLIVLAIFPTRGNYLDICIDETNLKGANNAIFIIVSNTSMSFITYSRRDDVKMRWHTDYGFLTNDVGHFFQEIVVLGPSRTERIENWRDVPLGSRAVDAGIRFVALTWVGRLAMTLPHTHFWFPIRDFLFSLDTSRTPEMTWSDAFLVTDSTNKPTRNAIQK